MSSMFRSRMELWEFWPIEMSGNLPRSHAKTLFSKITVFGCFWLSIPCYNHFNSAVYKSTRIRNFYTYWDAVWCCFGCLKVTMTKFERFTENSCFYNTLRIDQPLVWSRSQKYSIRHNRIAISYTWIWIAFWIIVCGLLKKRIQKL